MGDEPQASPAVAKDILSKEFKHHRDLLLRSLKSAQTTSRFILPLAASELALVLGIGSVTLSGVSIGKSTTYPLATLLLMLFGIIAIGFFGLVQANEALYSWTRLVQMERRLKCGLEGYYIWDYIDHATVWGEESSWGSLLARVSLRCMGVRVRNPMSLLGMAVIVWTGFASFVVAGADVYALWKSPFGALTTAIASGLAVSGLLLLSAWILRGSLPPSLKGILDSPAWAESYKEKLWKSEDADFDKEGPEPKWFQVSTEETTRVASLPTPPP